MIGITGVRLYLPQAQPRLPAIDENHSDLSAPPSKHSEQMDSRNPSKVLLATCIDAIGPARLPALFHAAGCRVDLFSPVHLAIRRSRFVDRYLPAPEDPAAFIDRLCRFLVEHREDYAWVQYGDEPVLRGVAARSRQDCPAACLPVPRTPEHIARITDKLVFLPAAAEAGLAIPPFSLCTDRRALADAAERLGYPFMLKRGEGFAGAGVRFVATEKELAASIDWECSPSHPLMAQAFLHGSVGSSEVLFNRGQPVAWFSSFHREFWPTPWTASCVRELTALPEAEDLLDRIGRLTEYHGFAGVDWLRSSADGQLYLIELNPRPTPCYHLGPRVGVDFAAAVREMIAGNSPAVQRPQYPSAAEALVYQFPQYCFRAIDDGHYARLPRVFGDVPRSDPLLVAAYVRRVATHYLPFNIRQRLRAWFRS